MIIGNVWACVIFSQIAAIVCKFDGERKRKRARVGQKKQKLLHFISKYSCKAIQQHNNQ